MIIDKKILEKYCHAWLEGKTEKNSWKVNSIRICYNNDGEEKVVFKYHTENVDNIFQLYEESFNAYLLYNKSIEELKEEARLRRIRAKEVEENEKKENELIEKLKDQIKNSLDFIKLNELLDKRNQYAVLGVFHNIR